MSLVYNDITAAAANVSALNSMLASQKVVELGEGELFHAGTITLQQHGNKLRGPGVGAGKLTNTQVAHSVETSPWDWDSIEISGLDIGWASGVVPTVNTCGINSHRLECPSILNNRITGAGIGVALRYTGYGVFKGNIVNGSKNIGVFMTQYPGLNNLQWFVEGNLVQNSVSHGYFVYGDPTLPVPGLTMGDWVNNRTFGNGGQGIAVVGSAAAPIQSFRMNGGFIGGDKAGEIYLDTYGTNHSIRGIYTELAQLGPGIVATASNGKVDITDSEISTMFGDGISSAAGDTLISGVRSLNNGWGGAGGYGFRIADGNKATITGTVTSGNATGPILLAANGSLLAGSGNKFA